MAYTALEQMRTHNLERFGADVGPFQPENNGFSGDDLKDAALRFLHERCETLGFSPAAAAEEERTGNYLGKGIRPGQVPYDMQRDVDRLCLARELERFIDSGVAEDAYNVYYCFLEIFFGHYGRSKKMIELLSEFESNGSSLLMKHRDHYSHSVYVFALGLAVYETNEHFRRIFKDFYHFDTAEKNVTAQRAAAGFFLEYWGLASLFHDIGYPFELPFEQVMSYFEVDQVSRGKGSIYLAYHDLGVLTRLSDGASAHLARLLGRTFTNTNDLLSFAITRRLGEVYGLSEEDLKNVIVSKPVSPNRFGYFMDHAYFSSARLYQEMEEALGAEKVTIGHIDALSAILLHNSLYKFSVAFYKDPEKCKPPLRPDLHPLAWLLMLSDELQCWDRTAYGRNSRTELHPMAASFDFSENALHAVYYYDSEEQPKIDRFKEAYAAWEKAGEDGAPPRLKAYSDMAEKEQRFAGDIRKIVDTAILPLTVVPDTRPADRRSKHMYLSRSNFLHLYDFAVALNARYSHQDQESEVGAQQLENEFESLSLEYQLSNINQAKSFSGYLNKLGLFYTDRPVDFDMVSEFTEEQAEIIAPMEHERWIREHHAMGWSAGSLYEKPDLEASMRRPEPLNRKALREQLRMHKLAMNGNPTEKEVVEHYNDLPEDEKGKDKKPFNSMLKLIRKFDGLRIYQLD